MEAEHYTRKQTIDEIFFKAADTNPMPDQFKIVKPCGLRPMTAIDPAFRQFRFGSVLGEKYHS